MALALIFRWKSLLYVLGHWGVAIGTSLAGIRTRVAGREHIHAGEAVVFCCNHQSNIDPPILFQALHPRLHILFKRELTKLPLLGKAFQIGGFVPIDRHSREQSMAAIDQAAASSGRQLVPHVSRRHAQPHRRAAAIQARTVPDGVEGAGAGRAGCDSGRRRRRCGRAAPSSGRRRERAHWEPVETRGMDMSDREKLAADPLPRGALREWKN